MNSTDSHIKVYDFFAGCVGTSLGFRKAGIGHALAIDCCPDAVSTFEKNFPDVSAISELFKNAHDAYADHAEVDYSKSDGLLMIRDDGMGMTPDEFEQNWLVLGTDSKLSGARPPSVPPRGKVPRAIMGEKGIGRLAIAFLGCQVLVITRSENGGAERPLHQPAAMEKAR